MKKFIPVLALFAASCNQKVAKEVSEVYVDNNDFHIVAMDSNGTLDTLTVTPALEEEKQNARLEFIDMVGGFAIRVNDDSTYYQSGPLNIERTPGYKCLDVNLGDFNGNVSGISKDNLVYKRGVELKQ